MKTKIQIICLLFGFLTNGSAFSQTPQAFKYQTVVRNGSGEILSSQNVSFRFSIHDANPSGIIVYSETHSALTNEFGLVSLNIGSGVPVSGNFDGIDWGNGSKFLEVELDPAGGSSYSSMGTSQMFSVPYALYSENTANNDDADADPANELQTLSIEGNNLSISDGNSVMLPGSGISNRISDNDGDTWIDAERNSDNDSIIFYTSGMERMVISHNGYVEVNGQMTATGFSGDGSGLTGIPGDDLGDHLATQDLDMNGNAVTNLDYPMIDTDAANKGYVDSHSGDNLGNHIATQNLAIGNFWISNDGNYKGIRIDTEGKVSINNAIADHELTVNGNIRAADQIMAGWGTSTNATYRFGPGLENCGFSSPLANTVSVITEGAARMTVSSSGNVGIGTTTPANTLHIEGSFRLANGTQANGRILTADANGTASWTEPSSMIQNEWHTTGNSGTVSGTNFIGTTDNVAFNFRVNNTEAGRIGSSDDKSVFLGYEAGLNDNLSNNQNTFIGYQTGRSNTIGSWNTAIGQSALHDNETGVNNTATGQSALYNNTTGGSNTAIGHLALFTNITGGGNTALGENAFLNGTNYSNATALGQNAAISASNQVRIGGSSVTSIGGYTNWTNLSDARFKKNVSENVPGLSFILKLKPVTYTLNVEKLNQFLNIPDSISKANDFLVKSMNEKSAAVQTGFIAQDVERSATELGFDFSGIDKPKNENDHYGLRYAEFVAPLVKAVQELADQNRKLMEQNELQAKDIEYLKSELNKLKNNH